MKDRQTEGKTAGVPEKVKQAGDTQEMEMGETECLDGTHVDGPGSKGERREEVYINTFFAK